MKRPPPNPLKFLTPSQLVMCLILFFLPWVEIQCPKSKAGAKADSFEELFDPANMVWTGEVQQSGIEIALGKVTYVDPQKQADKPKNPMGVGKAGNAGEKSDPDGAPLLWLYPVALLAGIGLGFAMSGKARKPALAGCCGLALLVAGGQAAMGMPVMNALEKFEKEMSAAGGPPMGGKDKESLDKIVQLKYKFPFYLSMFLLVGALGTALLEPTVAAPPPRRRDDDDDEEEEEERPRPKPKRKR